MVWFVWSCMITCTVYCGYSRHRNTEKIRFVLICTHTTFLHFLYTHYAAWPHKVLISCTFHFWLVVTPCHELLYLLAPVQNWGIDMQSWELSRCKHVPSKGWQVVQMNAESIGLETNKWNKHEEALLFPKENGVFFHADAIGLLLKPFWALTL